MRFTELNDIVKHICGANPPLFSSEKGAEIQVIENPEKGIAAGIVLVFQREGVRDHPEWSAAVGLKPDELDELKAHSLLELLQELVTRARARGGLL